MKNVNCELLRLVGALAAVALPTIAAAQHGTLVNNDGLVHLVSGMESGAGVRFDPDGNVSLVSGGRAKLALLFVQQSVRWDSKKSCATTAPKCVPRNSP